MLIQRVVKRVTIIFLIISLIYANLEMAIFGVISYAIEEKNVENLTEEKLMNIEISEFCKNDMDKEEKEYSEKVTINLKNESNFDEVIVTDIESNVIDVADSEKINTFYINTKIKKSELIDAIGKNGILEIKYIKLEQDNEEVISESKKEIDREVTVEENDDYIVLPDETITLPVENGTIIAESQLIKISNSTETDEEGYITVVYPEDVISVEITIVSDENNEKQLEIINNKTIKKIENIEEINLLKTTKNILVKRQYETVNYDETIETPIYYTKTVAELGMNKTQISTSVENKVDFTITMNTEKEIYDLYKNPQFVIELPNEIEAVNIEDAIILNNENFQVDILDVRTLENGNKVIIVILNGEQTEYTKSLIENTQILIKTSVETKKLIPNLTTEVKLHYLNENAKTYDGIGTQENGVAVSPIELISNSEIIVETKAIVGENIITSFKTDYQDVTIEPNTYKEIQIIGTAINNTGKNIENACILGTATNIKELEGIENVYYTENENATYDLNDLSNMWVNEYISNAKKFLILIENFDQGQTIAFNYTMELTENIEEDITHEVKFEVYNNQNIKTSKMIIHQEAERFDIFEDEFINAIITLKNTDGIQVNEAMESEIVVKNNSSKTLENISISITDLPEILDQKNVKVMLDGEYIDADIAYLDSEDIIIKDLNIEPDSSVIIELTAMISEFSKLSEKIQVKINYENREANITNKVKLIKPSEIETTITSNKIGEALQENEAIQYKATLTNNGQSNVNVTTTLPELNGINIYKIEVINVSTGEKTKLASASLAGDIPNIMINSGETVEIYIYGIAKDLKKDAIQTMYLNIEGKDAYSTTTNRLINKVDKKIELEEEYKNDNEEEIPNTIKGIAWIDRNQNGQKDDNESLLKGVQAVLIDTTTSEEIATEITNDKGEYNFNNIENGSYIVKFKYNTNILKITEYKSEDVEENLDSDIINTTQNNQTIAKTEVIGLTQGTTKQINAGFIADKEFDMSIKTGITSVTVNNKQGTDTYKFNNTNMAKVEIDGQYFKDSLILVEYEIEVTNVGEISGYAKLISDVIPEGMKFSSELNPNWYEEDDNTLYSVALADKEIAPGETETVKLILTKEMVDDKITAPLNTAKIEETFNDYLIEETKKENNISEATVIISLTTGQKTYRWIAIVFGLIILLGTLSVVKITNKSFVKINLTERRKTHGK